MEKKEGSVSPVSDKEKDSRQESNQHKKRKSASPSTSQRSEEKRGKSLSTLATPTTFSLETTPLESDSPQTSSPVKRVNFSEYLTRKEKNRPSSTQDDEGLKEKREDVLMVDVGSEEEELFENGEKKIEKKPKKAKTFYMSINKLYQAEKKTGPCKEVETSIHYF